jgi:hypothetical protein
VRHIRLSVCQTTAIRCYFFLLSEYRISDNNGMLYSTYRVSFETSFDSKQPKLVSALSETKHLFGCFAFISKQRVSMFQLNRNKQKTNRNSLIENIVWHFSENLGLFLLVSKQFCLFQLFRYRFETMKQTKTNHNFFFGFTKQTEPQLKQILVRFVSVRIKNFLFVSRTH